MDLRQTFHTELDLDSARPFAKIRPMLDISLHPNAMSEAVCSVTSVCKQRVNFTLEVTLRLSTHDREMQYHFIAFTPV